MCWGSNTYNQASAPEGTFLQVSAGYSHTCAVTTDAKVRCWGSMSDRKLEVPDETFALP
jgi:alpha-tubulin suppressor-like RCC1 family protein